MATLPGMGTPPLMCKIEMPSTGGGDEQYGGTRAINSAYTFSVDKQIGEGTYGQVFLGNDNQSDDKVALKKIRMDTEKEGFPITAIREIKILSTLQHENVVNLREIVRSDIHKNNNYKGSIYMVFDYADYDLTGLMETVKYKFTEAQVKCIMKQLLKGLAYVHGNGVLHRDLKASNILINSKGSVQLADFGLARTYQDRQEGRLTNRVITLWYRPPELLLGADRYGPEIDMWSVGCIFAELLVGKPLFPGRDETDQVDLIFKLLGTPTETTWPGVSKYEHWAKVPKERYLYKDKLNRLEKWVKDMAQKQGQHIKEDAIKLLQAMLSLDPTKRITAVEAFQDTWFWSEPMPCDPSALPCGGSSHEFTMKKRRIEEKEREENQRNAAHPAHHQHHGGAHQQQQQRGAGGGGQQQQQWGGAPPDKRQRTYAGAQGGGSGQGPSRGGPPGGQSWGAPSGGGHHGAPQAGSSAGGYRGGGAPPTQAAPHHPPSTAHYPRGAGVAPPPPYSAHPPHGGGSSGPHHGPYHGQTPFTAPKSYAPNAPPAPPGAYPPQQQRPTTYPPPQPGSWPQQGKR